MKEKSSGSKSFTLSPKTPEERGLSFTLSQKPSFRSGVFKGESGEKISGSKPVKMLNETFATAICGNDITSSCLYVAAICAGQAGYLAPVALLLVAFILYLYRNIYAEVGEALPLNGGAYNCLLNTTTKAKASIAACMTVLSYIATAVISAKTSMEYLNFITNGQIPVLLATCVLLGAFACLVIAGIGESAKAAFVIFCLHLTSLSLLCLGCLVMIIESPDILMENWGALPEGTSWNEALFFGFSVALLGVSGFESSSNFIEEQEKGVFPKTLRNMWLAVTIFNPLIAFVALGMLSMSDLVGSQKYLLAEVAQRAGGPVAATLMSVNAAIVLSGAVLASFVGVTGLVSRMTLDRCLPQYLNKRNGRGTYHRIIFMFLALCISIVLITGGELRILAGVYTISFLGVMCLFSLGNILLKLRRSRLPRTVQAGWFPLFLALTATIGGIIGNIYLFPENFRYFSIYFFPTVAFVLIILHRQQILKLFLVVLDDLMNDLAKSGEKIKLFVQGKIREITNEGIIFFTKGDDVASLNRAMLYVLENESTKVMTIVHILDGTQSPPPRLVRDLRLLDEIYPELNVELVIRKGRFGPDLIRELSNEFGIAPNYMFVGTPGNQFPHRISDLGGVRVII